MNIIQFFIYKFKKWREKKKRLKELQEEIWIEEVKRVYGTDKQERIKDYKEYLMSDRWKKLRDLAVKESNGKCKFCGDKASEVHHIKYPRLFSEDGLSNLAVCCKKCHKLQHGINDNQKTIEDYK